MQDEEVSNIKRVLEVLLRGRSGPVTPRPKFTTVSIQQDENKRELLYTLMGGCTGSSCMEVKSSKTNHAAVQEYTCRSAQVIVQECLAVAALHAQLAWCAWYTGVCQSRGGGLAARGLMQLREQNTSG
jgi:hypothetical protein